MVTYRKRKAGRQGGRAKRARTYRRGMRRMGVTPSLVSRQVHTFTRFAAPLIITGNVVHSPYRGNTSLSLATVNNSTEFSNLYDQYRIVKVITKFYLRVDPAAQNATTAYVPRLFWYRDYDDSDTPLNLTEMRENARTKMRCLSPYKPVTIVTVPNTLGLIYYTPVTNGYKPVFKQWLDCSNLAITHYMCKFAIDNLTNTNYSVEVENQLVFQCRNSR